MLKRLVKTCLAKDPEARFQTARDLKRALEWSRLQEAAGPAIAPSRHRGWLAWAVAVLLALAAGILAFLHFGQKPPEMRLVKFTTLHHPKKFRWLTGPVPMAGVWPLRCATRGPHKVRV
jgi:hypothetical protein